MKYIIVLVWMFSYSSLVYSQTECSSSGEYAVISDKLTQIVIPDRSIVQPYEPDITIPSVCNVDRTCNSLLFEVENEEKLREKHFWAPNNGPMHYFKLNVNESLVTYGPTLHGNDCFKFFHIEQRLLGALCIGRIHDEKLIVPYKIEYNEHGEPQDNQLGITIHLNVENHSPFITLNNTGVLKVVGISYFEHLSVYKLFIIHYNTESHDVIDVPTECTGPHDLQPVKQSDAVIRCANGKVLYFNGWYSTFTMLSHNNIEIVSTCPNTTSFVLVQRMGNIIFNKSGVVYQLSVNISEQQQGIASAVCYATGEDDIIYYFTDASSSAVYKVYLGDVLTGSSRQAMVPLIVRDDVAHDGAVINLYIDGPILWAKLASSNYSDVTVYITDLLTEKQSGPVSINGPNVFVQLYTAEKCEHNTIKPTTPNGGKQENSNGQTIGDMPRYILISLGTIIAVVLLIGSLIGFVAYHRYCCRRPVPRRNTENESLEMEPIGDTQSADRSQTPGSNDNSTAALLERYETDDPPVPTAPKDDHSIDKTPVQTKDQQPGELVSPTTRTVLVDGLIKKDKTATTNPSTTVAVSNPGPSALDDVD